MNIRMLRNFQACREAISTVSPWLFARVE